MNRRSGFIFLLIPFFLWASGCEKPANISKYHEVLIDSPKKSFDGNDPHAFLKMMPDDNIHSQLRFDNAPANMPGDRSAPPSQALMDSVASVPLSWSAPQGWLEKKGSGMRVATFINSDQDSPVETTIVSLAGAAGGVSANITRWLQQLKLAVPSSQQLDEFIQKQAALKIPSGLSATLVDFTQLQNESGPEADSMIAAIIERKDSQIFVKMTGSKKAVLKNLDSFKSLINSIKINQ